MYRHLVYFDGSRRRWLKQVCETLTTSMFHPVTIAHGNNCDHRNSQKNSRNASQFSARQDRKNYGERMQMNTLSNETRVNEIVLRDSQHSEKDQNQESGKRSGMQ